MDNELDVLMNNPNLYSAISNYLKASIVLYWAIAAKKQEKLIEDLRMEVNYYEQKFNTLSPDNVIIKYLYLLRNSKNEKYEKLISLYKQFDTAYREAYPIEPLHPSYRI